MLEREFNNTIRFFLGLRFEGPSKARREATSNLGPETQVPRIKFGMCVRSLDPSPLRSLELYPASKGTDDGSVAGTENFQTGLHKPRSRCQRFLRKL